MNRKTFLKCTGTSAVLAAMGGLSATNRAVHGQDGHSTRSNVPGAERAVYVPNGRDRFEEELMIWGVIPLQIKISTADTGGALFAFEHANMGRGGPPRHLHYEQDEWFYAMKGEFAFEVGDEQFTLRPGDSLFAPRMVPHAWAYVGNEPGTLLLAVQPAGSLEAFFRKSCEMTQPPTPEEADRMFAAHGMKVVGPPLQVG